MVHLVISGDCSTASGVISGPCKIDSNTPLDRILINKSFVCPHRLLSLKFPILLLDAMKRWQTPGDELKWVRNAAEEDTVALASQRGMVVCIGCDDDKVLFH